MMWPFSSTPSLEKSGVFNGFTDWHSHILPGVDDGIESLSDSLAVLGRFEELGVEKVWLTPHVMEDFPNTVEKLRERFGELLDAYTGRIRICLASENMLDSLFQERLVNNEFLPLGDGGSHLLVETSYYNPPYGMDDMIKATFRLGYTPVLAHPERYRYMEEADYEKWKERGLLFQGNVASLAGTYGDTARKKLEWLLSKGMIDMFGSDLHRLSSFDQNIRRSPSGSALRLLRSAVGL